MFNFSAKEKKLILIELEKIIDKTFLRLEKNLQTHLGSLNIKEKSEN